MAEMSAKSEVRRFFLASVLLSFVFILPFYLKEPSGEMQGFWAWVWLLSLPIQGLVALTLPFFGPSMVSGSMRRSLTVLAVVVLSLILGYGFIVTR